MRGNASDSAPDSRGVRTSYEYDELNRLKSKTYSSDASGTPAVTYSYDDMAVTYGKGRLTKVTNANATTSYLTYDALGRVLQSDVIPWIGPNRSTI